MKIEVPVTIPAWGIRLEVSGTKIYYRGQYYHYVSSHIFQHHKPGGMWIIIVRNNPEKEYAHLECNLDDEIEILETFEPLIMEYQND